MKRIGFSALLLALLTASPANAQESLQQGLERCASIRNAAERLFCFDSLAAGSPASESAPSPAARPASPVSSTPVTPPPSSNPSPPARETSASSSDFGLELEKTREGPQSISSRYDGTFDGWTGETVFPLENGQVWQQVETDRLAFRAERPVITIRRGWFGVYYLKVQGANKQIRVKRIK